MRRTWLSLHLLMWLCLPAAAAEVTDLYRAETVVTGTEEPERTRGFRIGLTDVVVKLTGDARLEGAPALATLLADPHAFVASYEYEDRMKDIPVHDEQGTRERPHFLRMAFEPGQIDRALKTLGLRKWSSDRPRIAVWLAIRTALGSHVLHASGAQGYGQRWVLEDTSRRRGIPVWLPPSDDPASGITYEDVAGGGIGKVRAATTGTDLQAFLLGTLVLAAAGYWDIRWTLHWKGTAQSWDLQEVTFDAALKDGLQHAALIISDNL